MIVRGRFSSLARAALASSCVVALAFGASCSHANIHHTTSGAPTIPCL